MKKILLVLAVLLVFAGCSAERSDTSQQQGQTTNLSKPPVESVTNSTTPNSAGVQNATDNSASEQKSTVSNGKKILVAYFSRSGNTKFVADEIQKRINADVFRIETKTEYPTDYNKTVEIAEKEQKDNARPELKAKVENFESYDVIFLGFPNWWGTLPMSLFTFLESHDFSGKTIIPFCTHNGTAFGRSLDDMKKLCPKANIVGGFEVRAQDIKTDATKKNVANWLDKINYNDTKKP
ncbi:MAG: hypothetical protein LBQ66_04255 [Planctomycetaceae bacterium]|nr:hypothetical protein [Planctomycetaceae bacterium]